MPNARFRMLDRAPEQLKPQADVAAETRPGEFRGAGFVPGKSRYGGWVALSVVIVLWQLAGSAGLVNPLFLPTPLAICRAIYQLASSGALWQHLAYSLMRIGIGWLVRPGVVR